MKNRIDLHKGVYSEPLRKRAEKEFHDDFFCGKQIRKAQVKFYDQKITDFLLKYAYLQMGSLENKRILYYGCGVNKEPLLNFISQGAYVVAVDLSSEAINIMKGFINEQGVNKKAEALEMDAENLSFGDATFDVVFGTAVLHHLDIIKSSAEIIRVLKIGGKAIFVEPLGMNPLINLYRLMTPKDRTKDEHPLKHRDLNLLKKNFSNYKQQNFYFLSLLAFFWKFIKNNTLFHYSLKILIKLDNLLFRILPFLKSYCWCTVVILEK